MLLHVSRCLDCAIGFLLKVGVGFVMGFGDLAILVLSMRLCWLFQVFSSARVGKCNDRLKFDIVKCYLGYPSYEWYSMFFQVSYNGIGDALGIRPFGMILQ